MTNPIFVFGSNLAGRHGKGAARDAVKHYGAKRGVGEGRTGNAYAIPTKDGQLCPLSLRVIQRFVDRFRTYAFSNQGNHLYPHNRLIFQVTRVGCGLAGYNDEQIAPMFHNMPNNVDLPEGWQEITDAVSDSYAAAKAGGR